MAEAGPQFEPQNCYTEDEFKSLNYRWMDQQVKKTKYFVFSTTNFFQRDCPPSNHKGMKEFESGRKEDIDFYRIKDEFITKNIRSDEDVLYCENLTMKQFWNLVSDIKQDKIQDKIQDKEKDKEDKKKAKEIGKEKTLKQYDCFFFMFFTFSSRDTEKTSSPNVKEEKLHFKDGLISIHEIWDKIKEIEHFHGKPKLFFIQSDNLKLLHPDQKAKASPENFECRKLPTDADFLIIQSTIPGQYARQFDEKDKTPSASFLVQAFLEAMSENKTKPEIDQVDMLNLTTAINRKVKSKIKNLKERDVPFTDYLPYPQVTSTFTKLLYL